MATQLAEYGDVEIRSSNEHDQYLIHNCTVVEGQNLVKGTVIGLITSGDDEGKVKAYANGNSDGSQTAIGIIKQAVDATAGDCQAGYYAKGGFIAARLTGMDSNAKTDLGAKENVQLGTIEIYGA